MLMEFQTKTPLRKVIIITISLQGQLVYHKLRTLTIMRQVILSFRQYIISQTWAKVADDTALELN